MGGELQDVQECRDRPAATTVGRPIAGSAPPIVRHAEYRPDIDGLRAVAVLGVLVFHAAPQLLPGGFAGVDVFFVISGFLISGIILRALQRQRFSIVEFYMRRIKRIFPALIAMLLVIWTAAWPLFLWDEYQRLGKHIVAGAGFALNLLLYADFNLYFGVTTSPLIHLWSLGVEEQFYIVWPVLLLVLWKWSGPRGRSRSIALIAAISFAMNVAALSADPTASFYLPSSRMWELAMGALLAHAQLNQRTSVVASRWPRSRSALPHLLGTGGAALILAAFGWLDSRSPFPGWLALLPCVGACLVIAAGPGSWVNRHVLSNPSMVFIGLISYPLYLWHWPVLSIVHIVRGHEPVLLAVAVLASIVLAFLTYRYVELPIRSSDHMARLTLVLCSAMAACAGIGYLTAAGNIHPRSAGYELDRFINATREDWYSKQRVEWTWFTGLIHIGDGPQRVLFIGDSNMQQYYPRIAKLVHDFPLNTRGADFAVRPGCAPVVIELLGPRANPHSMAECRAFLQDALRYAEQPQVQAIVIAAYWRGYAIAGATNIADFRELPLNASTDAVFESLRKVIAQLVSHGKRVYVVLNIPTSPSFDPRRMIRRSLGSSGFRVEIHNPTRVQIENAIGPVTAKLRRIAQEAGAEIIDPVDSLCDPAFCPAVTASGEPIYRDFGHLRPSYVRDAVTYLDATVLEEGGSWPAR